MFSTWFEGFNVSIGIMSSTSQKHRHFSSEPMHDKLVTELAGIGSVLGDRLSEAGFDLVSSLNCMYY